MRPGAPDSFVLLLREGARGCVRGRERDRMPWTARCVPMMIRTKSFKDENEKIQLSRTTKTKTPCTINSYGTREFIVFAKSVGFR